MQPRKREAPACPTRRRPSVSCSTTKQNGTEFNPNHLTLQVRRLRQRLGISETMAVAIAPLAFGEVAR